MTDIALGAWGDDNGASDAGSVTIVFMNRDGTAKGSQAIRDADLAGVLDTSDRLGFLGLAAVGDVNRDGTPDIAVGAYLDDDGGSDRGAVYLILLNSDGTVK